MRCSFRGELLSSVLPPLLLAQFVVGAVGNGLALWIFCFRLKPWRSSTVLLFNLALADFLLILALPFRAWYYGSGLRWTFGGASCNICLFALAMNRSGSTLFLMAVALDRYVRVVHPHHALTSLSAARAAWGAAGLWLLAVSMSAQVFTLQHHNSTSCQSLSLPDTGGLAWHRFAFLFSFYGPFLVILGCTVSISLSLRRRPLLARTRTARRLLVLVLLLFLVCFLPSNVAQVAVWYQVTRAVQSRSEREVCAAREDLSTVFNICISLTYMNSVLDPLVYYFSSPAFKNILRRRPCSHN